MSAILKFDFLKKRTVTFFWSKLSKLHKKDPILHVATTFSLKGKQEQAMDPFQDNHKLIQLWFLSRFGLFHN